jgi:hypothetical protein
MNRSSPEACPEDHERLDATGGVAAVGIQAMPVMVRRSQTLPHVANVRSVDPEQLYSEDKLGCARGVVWALVFQAALVIVAVVCWELHVLTR